MSNVIKNLAHIQLHYFDRRGLFGLCHYIHGAAAPTVKTKSTFEFLAVIHAPAVLTFRSLPFIEIQPNTP